MSSQTVGGLGGMPGPGRPAPADDSTSDSSGAADRVDDLTRRSLRWLVLTAVVSRVAITIPAVILNRSVLGEQGDRILPLAAAVIVIDLAVLAVVLRRPGLLITRWLFTADIALTVAATVVATLLIPAGTFLLPGSDALTGYGWGTVVLWTGIRGWRTGAGLLVATPVLQVVMAELNGADFDAAGIANVISRVGIALMSLAIAVAVVVLARRGARWTVSEGLRAGRLAERAETLRSLHDFALAELDAVVLTTSRSALPEADRLAVVIERAARQAALLRQADVTTEAADGLVDRLAALVADFRARGLSVALVGRPSAALPGGARGGVDALVGSVREALNNVAKHAEVAHAVVRIAPFTDQVTVEIIDRGRGFVPGPDHAGFGLLRSIGSRMGEAGGKAHVTSAPGEGTRVRLTLPTPRTPAATLVDATAGTGVTWIPIVPLIWRLLCLPMIGFHFSAFLPGHAPVVDLVLVGLFLGQVVLLTALSRPGAARVLRSPLVLVIDVAVAAGFYLWTATVEPPGSILFPNSDGGWLYVIGTVPFWMAARGVAVGVPVLLGALALLFAAVTLNGVSLSADNWSFVLLHVVQVVATAGSVVLVMRMARRGAELGHAEGLRAGRQAERVDVFADLHDRVLATWDAIAAPTDGVDPARRLDSIRTLAAAMAGALRAALRADRRDTGGNGLADALDSIAQDARRRGLRVELVVTELTGDPPPEVVSALARAVGVTLRDSAARSPEASITLRVSGSPEHAQVVMRESVVDVRPSADVAAVMKSVGGHVVVRRVADRGTRTTLRWSENRGR